MAEPTREIEPEFFEWLGRIVTRWSFAEALIAEFFAFLLDASPGYVYILTQNVSNSTLVNWIRTALSLRITDEEVTKMITDVLNHTDAVRTDRNVLVHGLWATHLSGPETVAVQTLRYERSEIMKTELVTLADLKHLHEEIGDVIGALLGLDSVLHFTTKSTSNPLGG